jgi:hypothetical protein
MSTRNDWFRKTKWSSKDAEEFEQHLARARSQRTQYLKLQAWHLAETGRVEVADVAIRLARRYLEQDPCGLFKAQAHLIIAKASATKQDVPGALQAYREAISAEAQDRGPRSSAILDYVWFVATHQAVDAFDDALMAMDSYDKSRLMFPIEQYRFFGALAFIADEMNDREHARRMARNALDAAGKVGPFRRHRRVGVVSGIPAHIRNRIRQLSA